MSWFDEARLSEELKGLREDLSAVRRLQTAHSAQIGALDERLKKVEALAPEPKSGPAEVVMTQAELDSLREQARAQATLWGIARDLGMTPPRAHGDISRAVQEVILDRAERDEAAQARISELEAMVVELGPRVTILTEQVLGEVRRREQAEELASLRLTEGQRNLERAEAAEARLADYVKAPSSLIQERDALQQAWNTVKVFTGELRQALALDPDATEAEILVAVAELKGAHLAEYNHGSTLAELHGDRFREMKALEIVRDSLEIDLSAARAQLTDTEKRYDTAEREVEALKVDLTTVRAQLADEEKRADTLEEKLATTEGLARNLQAKLRTAETLNTELDQARDNAFAQVDKLKELLVLVDRVLKMNTTEMFDSALFTTVVNDVREVLGLNQ